MRARASEGEGEDEGYRRETRQGDRNKKQDKETEKIFAAQQAHESLHGQESHTEMRGNEATVAFYPDLLMIELDQGICTTTATLYAK